MQRVWDDPGIYSVARATDEQLAHCYNEPIHIPEAIQPHGFLLQVDLTRFQIQRASENTLEYIGVSAESLLGREVSRLIPNSERMLAELEGLTRREVHSTRLRRATNRIRLDAELSIPKFDCEAHVLVDGSLVLEFEPNQAAAPAGRIEQERAQCLQTIYDTQEAGGSLDEVFQLTAAAIHKFTQYDRVMIYQMNEEGHGAITAETKRDGLESYLGLHFPASDIPKQARELYLLNRVRLLSDLRYPLVPLVAMPALKNQRLDMSMCQLRSVSPVHVEYLANMGVSATLVISIVVDNKLWGLIACHHYSPKHIDSRQRHACEEISRCISSVIRCASVEEERHALVGGVTFQRRLESKLDKLRWIESMRENSDWLLDELEVAGILLLSDNERYEFGLCPPATTLDPLRQHWRDSGQTGETFVRSLQELVPQHTPSTQPIAGCARTVIAESPVGLEILLFRREERLHVEWGGDPRKPMVQTTDAVRLSPRLSFERWCQDVEGYSVPWSPSDKCKLREFSNFVAARRIEDTARQKEQFLANMSHELRTPLTAIIGYCDIAGDLVEGIDVATEVGKSLQTIRRNGQHLLSLINDVLDISKVQSAGIGLLNKAVRFDRLAVEIEELLGPHARGKGLSFTIDSAGVSGAFMVDDGRLKQVLTNLIGNAIKFTDVGQVSLTVTKASDREVVHFTVVDTGIGIPANHHGKLFTPFYQAHDGYSRKYGGTGLGIALSRELARAMGGELRLIRSLMGEETVFELELPYLPANDTSLVAEFQAATNERSTIGQASARVLLVEDGVDNQRLISYILKKEGFDVTLANNGLEAIQLCEVQDHEAFDIILMDMQMPVMDGYTATLQLRQNGWTGPIIALTAHAMPSDREKCLQVGCDEYTSKPVDRPRLIAKVRHLLDLSPT